MLRSVALLPYMHAATHKLKMHLLSDLSLSFRDGLVTVMCFYNQAITA